MKTKLYKRPPKFRGKGSRKFTAFINYKPFENGEINFNAPPGYNWAMGYPDRGNSIPDVKILQPLEIGSLKV